VWKGPERGQPLVAYLSGEVDRAVDDRPAGEGSGSCGKVSGATWKDDQGRPAEDGSLHSSREHRLIGDRDDRRVQGAVTAAAPLGLLLGAR
jgi:hypothetical protein